jgi:hypothetical protein
VTCIRLPGGLFAIAYVDMYAIDVLQFANHHFPIAHCQISHLHNHRITNQEEIDGIVSYFFSVIYSNKKPYLSCVTPYI